MSADDLRLGRIVDGLFGCSSPYLSEHSHYTYKAGARMTVVFFVNCQ